MISKSMVEQINKSSTIRSMFEEGKRLASIYGDENVFDFSIGNPNVQTPAEIKGIINNILNEEESKNIHGYMNNSGYENVRNSIANKINIENNLNLNKDNIIMTCGAAGGLNILLKTFLDKEDEVIVFSPFFGEYIHYVNNYGGKVVIAPTILETFQPNFEKFESLISNKTKAVIINSPNNPTGVIYSEETIKKISTILENKQNQLSSNIYVISDEPYREIVYEDEKVPNILKYYVNSIICYSYSKSLSLPGERIGYLVVNEKINYFEEIISGLNISNRILGFVNAPSLFQKVVQRALDLEIDVNLYKQNRDAIYNHLISLGIECVKPKGAFYLFPKCPIEDDKKFCEDAKKYNILLVPGSTFNCKGYFRLAYCVPYEKILKSLSAFTELMKLYR